MPSLNQLAARINLNPTSSASSASRPRLAASLLRTGSSASVASSVVSNADSTAVNAPSTRSTSPTQLNVSPPHSNTATPIGDGGEQLTAENLDELNNETEKLDNESEAKDQKTAPMIRGYKNIPGLDAIAARMAKARTLSVDGTAKPPEADVIEDPKTPGVMMKAPEHPLEYHWSVWCAQPPVFATDTIAGRSIMTASQRSLSLQQPSL
jgi:translation initiation factor 4E